jgi:hypothetical protein
LNSARAPKRSNTGAATILGAVLILALFVMMFAFVQEVYFTQVKMNQVDTDKIQENILITSAYINTDGQIVLNIVNRGSLTANLVRLWVINQTDNTYWDFPFSEFYIHPGASATNITNAVFTSGQDYSIRLVTERGNIASYNLVPAVQARIDIIAPSTSIIGNNVTVVLSITNNDTSGNNIYNLEPNITVTPSSSLERLEGPIPERVELLPAGMTANFVYVYKVTGSGLSITLNGTFNNAPHGNYANTTIYATTVSVAAGNTNMPILELDAMGSIPALLDDGAGWTYWGITLVNPYNRSIAVYSVAAIAPTSTLFKEASGPYQGINPSTGWFAIRTNSFSGILWQSTTNPIIIEPYSAYSFTFSAEVTGTYLETPINVEAITTEGKFLKSFTTSADKDYPSINLYLTETPSNPTDSKIYTKLNTPASSTQTYTVAIYNSGNTALNSKISLLLRIPVGWVNITASNQPDWNSLTQSITQQNDGSWLITTESTSSTLDAGQTRTFQFSAVTPAVTSKTLYVLSLTAYYPQFMPSITAAYCGAVIQITP